MYFVYSLLFTIAGILSLPFYLYRKGKALGLRHWRERLGRIPYHEDHAGAIWVHAVSVGETLAVAGLVRTLQQEFPHHPIYLSHVTPAGREAGEARLTGVAGRFYLPLDWRWAVRRVFARLRPSLLVIVETELWPNLLRASQEAGTRVVLVNARLSERSWRRYKWVRPFMQRVLADVDVICAQTERDAERFRSIGAGPDRVRMVGNLKFDQRPPEAGPFAHALKAALRRSRRGPVLVAASTMPGEEPLVLEAWDIIRARYKGALLILAPRHPARFDEVAAELEKAARSFQRRTLLDSGERGLESSLASAPVLLLDTIGELAGIFEVADLVFVGGSLVPRGGHNILEPAYWSKVISFGPHMENFADIAKLFLDAGAAIQVRNPAELAHAAWLLENAEARQQLGASAKAILEQNAGATERTLACLREILSPAPAHSSATREAS